MIELWIYLAGYLWFWRYHVGYAIHEVSDYSDVVDISLCNVFLGTITAMFWPLTVTGRGLYILWTKYDLGERVGGLERFFPGPKEIETSHERKRRLLDEREEELERRERWVKERGL